MVFLRFPIFPETLQESQNGAFERALFAPSFLYLSSLFFSSWCAFWLRYCVARIKLKVKEPYDIHTWGLQTFNSYRETQTQVAEFGCWPPQKRSLQKGFVCPFFPSSFLSFLFFLVRILVEVFCGEVCKIKCQKIKVNGN